MSISCQMISINVGKPEVLEHQEKDLKTGIFKHPVKGSVYLSKVNFEGDGQADLIHHGGKDKAVCVYAYEHYPYWENDLKQKLTYGAFGENLTMKGMLEQDVCLGDIFQLGEAVVQVSQPRQPCFKLAARYRVVDLPVRIQNTGYTGFYFRVLEEGLVSSDLSFSLIKPHPSQVTIAYANTIMYHDKQNMAGMHKILEVEELSESWRETLSKRLG